MAAVISESQITLNIPDNNFFRFESCKGYKDIQNNFKEMDVCWYEQQTDTLYIIELKDWQNNDLDEESNPNISKSEITETKKRISTHRINQLLKKSVDSVSMFMSILLERPYSSTIQECAPFKITKATKIKLLSIINWTSSDVTYISTIDTAYRSKFNAYAKLYQIETFMVLTKQQAAAKFNWIS